MLWGILGILATLGVAWWTLDRSSKTAPGGGGRSPRGDARLRKLSNLTLKALEEAGLARLDRDDEGKIVGIVLEASVEEGVVSGAKATGSLTKVEDDDAET